MLTDYINAAMQHATYEMLKGASGTYYGHIAAANLTEYVGK